MPSVRFALSALAIATGISTACSSDDSPSAPSGGPTVRFSIAKSTPGFMDVPFPSDAYLSNGRVIEIPGVDAVVKQNSKYLVHELAKQDGFSRIAWSLFFVDDTSKGLDENNEVTTAEIDASTLPSTETECASESSSVFLVDLAATDPAKALVPCRAQFHHPAASRSRPSLGIGPARGVVLEEGHAYAAVVTSRVKDKSGRKLLGSAGFAAATTNPGAAAFAPLYVSASKSVQTALGAALAKDGAKVVGIAPFTTNKLTHELYDAREQLETAPAPTLKWDAASLAPMGAGKFAAAGSGGVPAGFTDLDAWLGKSKDKLPSGSDDPDATLAVRAHDKIAAVATTTFDAVNFLQDKGSYDTLDHATFAHDAQGRVIPAPEKPTSKIWLTIAIPNTPMPKDGYPVVIVQHGLSGSREYLMLTANTWAAQGWAAVAIDSVTFGARAPGKQYQVDAVNNFADKASVAAGASYAGPDGFADAINGATNGSSDFFGSLLNIGALRDQLRQASLDTAQVVKVLRSNPDLSPLKTGADTPKFDGARIAYIGDSLGGIEGSMAAAIEPRVSAWYLNVAGGGILTELAAYSPVISKQLALAGGFNFGFQSDVFTPSHPMVTLVQSVTDLGDPLTYASAIVTKPAPLAGAPTKPRNVVQVEVLFDEVVSNEGNEALARAAGFALASPNAGSNVEVSDLAHPERSAARIPWTEAKPDGAGAIHDAPGQGFTAVVVQAGPGTHGADLVQSRAKRQFLAPFAQFDTQAAFPPVDAPYDVPCPYRTLQAMGVTFFADAFDGKTPRVMGFSAPARDLDGDGTPDASDPDVNDPKKK